MLPRSHSEVFEIYNQWLFFDICIILKDKRFKMPPINQKSYIFWSFFSNLLYRWILNTFHLLHLLLCSLPKTFSHAIKTAPLPHINILAENPKISIK